MLNVGSTFHPPPLDLRLFISFVLILGVKRKLYAYKIWPWWKRSTFLKMEDIFVENPSWKMLVFLALKL